LSRKVVPPYWGNGSDFLPPIDASAGFTNKSCALLAICASSGPLFALMAHLDAGETLGRWISPQTGTTL
jgi:hypothetical protein